MSIAVDKSMNDEGESWLLMDDSHFRDMKEELKVCMNVVVLNLADISTASQSYTMHLELWVAWPLRKEEVQSYYKDPDNWKPDIHPEPTPWTIEIIANNKMKFLSGRTTQVFMWRNQMVACECSLVTARYLEALELVNFPFDCQHLNFMIGVRCDCDLPVKVMNDGNLHYKKLESTGGFYNFDGRAMAPMKLNPHACTFNVRGHLLSLQDYQLWGIECEIENKPDDIPFLHCSIRISRYYQPYITRIFLPIFIIMFNSTLVFRFKENILDAKLNYVITNMLTIVAFLFILQSSLPDIPYLTIIDKYTNFSFIYILVISMVCVLLSYLEVEEGFIEGVIFLGMLCILGLSHIIMALVFQYYRQQELSKMALDRHTVREMDDNNQNQESKQPEYLVHTAIHPQVGKHHVHVGSLRKRIQPVEAAGWLFEGEGTLRESIHEPTPLPLQKLLRNLPMSFYSQNPMNSEHRFSSVLFEAERNSTARYSTTRDTCRISSRDKV